MSFCPAPFARPHRSVRSLVAAAAALTSFASADALHAQTAGSTNPVVSLHVRGTLLKDDHPNGVTAGVQFRGAGHTYLLGSLDATVFKLRESSGFIAAPGTRVYVLRLSPPGLRLGVGHGSQVGDATLRGEAYVGNQGVIDGFQPLAGAGLAMGRAPWAVTADAVFRRADVYEVTSQPSTSVPGPTVPRGHAWRPSVEVGARWDVGSLGRSATARTGGVRSDRLERPIAGGLAGGALGVAAGVLAAVPVVTRCTGDEVCGIPLLVGGALGGTVGIPVGVHVADGRRGNVYASTLASLGIAALGIAAVRYTGDSGDPAQSISVLVPIAQIAASTFIERHTARR